MEEQELELPSHLKKTSKQNDNIYKATVSGHWISVQGSDPREKEEMSGVLWLPQVMPGQRFQDAAQERSTRAEPREVEAIERVKQRHRKYKKGKKLTWKSWKLHLRFKTNKQTKKLGGINSGLYSKRKDDRTWKFSSRNYPKLLWMKHDWKKKSGQSFHKLGSFRQPDIHIIGVLKGDAMSVRRERCWKIFLCFHHHLVIWRHDGQHFFKSDDPRGSVNSNGKEREENHTRTHLNQIALNQW